MAFAYRIFLWQIAAEVSAPLANTGEIVLLGGNDHITGELNRLVSQIPPSVQALTGVDLSKVSTSTKHNSLFIAAHMWMFVGALNTEQVCKPICL